MRINLIYGICYCESTNKIKEDNMSKIIEVENLYKHFNNETVLHNINFNVNTDEIFGIIGESGSGKSTLLRCINGLLSISKGNVSVNNTLVNKLNKKKLNAFREDIGMIFQDFSLVERHTVFENISLPLKIKGIDKLTISKKVTEVANNLGIEDKLKSKPNSLSGGQKQRVAIARALVTNPRIILSDESTSALDPENTRALLEIFKDLNKSLGVTIVLVSHEMDVIRYACDRVLLLKEGKVEKILSPEELYFEEFFNKEPNRKNVINLAVDSSFQTKLLFDLISNFGDKINILNNQTETFKDNNISFYSIEFENIDLKEIEIIFNNYQVNWRVK